MGQAEAGDYAKENSADRRTWCAGTFAVSLLVNSPSARATPGAGLGLIFFITTILGRGSLVQAV